MRKLLLHDYLIVAFDQKSVSRCWMLIEADTKKKKDVKISESEMQ
jgi:hypothetical protein